ncbi:hypothetical protein RIF29_38904 [Crotalaria pallida]|uniref:Uncharacterized protein n=1 Tax=Crotalaria pallida TaxID=3830 RepID=A0AAN9E123_CROPI
MLVSGNRLIKQISLRQNASLNSMLFPPTWKTAITHQPCSNYHYFTQTYFVFTVSNQIIFSPRTTTQNSTSIVAIPFHFSSCIEVTRNFELKCESNSVRHFVERVQCK